MEDLVMLNDIRAEGAKAARMGQTIWDCPFLRANAMPAHTGESFIEWDERVRAWEAGWRQETAERSRERGTMISAWIEALRSSKGADSADQKLDLFCAHGHHEKSSPPSNG